MQRTMVLSFPGYFLKDTNCYALSLGCGFVLAFSRDRKKTRNKPVKDVAQNRFCQFRCCYRYNCSPVVKLQAKHGADPSAEGRNEWNLLRAASYPIPPSYPSISPRRGFNYLHLGRFLTIPYYTVASATKHLTLNFSTIITPPRFRRSFSRFYSWSSVSFFFSASELWRCLNETSFYSFAQPDLQ